MGTKAYTVGKGKVLFNLDRTVDGVRAKGLSYLDFGNAPAFQVTLNSEKLDHYSSRSGLQLKDMSIIAKAEATGQFTLDEPKGDNLRMFFMSALNAMRDQASNGTLAALNGEGDSTGQTTAAALGAWFPLYTSVAGTKTNSAIAQDANNQGTALASGMTLSGTQTDGVSHTYTIRVAAEGASGALTVICRRDAGAWNTTPIVVTDNTNFNVLYGADVDSGLDFKVAVGDCAKLTEGDTFTFSVTVTATASQRVYNLDSTGDYATVVKDDMNNTLTVGETGHVQIDYAGGMVYVNEVQPVLNPIQAGDVLTITSGWSALDDISLKKAFSTTTLKGHLYFLGAPPQGQIIDVKGYCSITPTGDFQLIQENAWQQFQFNVEFLTDPEGSYGTGLFEVINRGQVG